MRALSAVANKQKGRPIAGGGLSINFVTNDANADTTIRAQIQYLRSRYSIAPAIAATIANLAFGGAV